MPFITVTHPPKYPLTESERRWLHERKNVKGWAFCLHCPPGKKGFPCTNWLYHFCPTDGGQDFKTAAEFEARVAAKLATMTCDRFCPDALNNRICRRGWADRRPMYACRLKRARLEVEEEMP